MSTALGSSVHRSQRDQLVNSVFSAVGSSAKWFPTIRLGLTFNIQAHLPTSKCYWRRLFNRSSFQILLSFESWRNYLARVFINRFTFSSLDIKIIREQQNNNNNNNIKQIFNHTHILRPVICYSNGVMGETFTHISRFKNTDNCDKLIQITNRFSLFGWIFNWGMRRDL